MMAADRRLAGRDYAWRGPRRINLRSGDIAVRTAPAAGRRVRAVVTSDGIGGTGGVGGAVPSGDGCGRVVAGPGSGWGAAGSGTMSSLGRWGPPQRPRRPRGQRPAGTLRRRMAGERLLADAQQCRRQLPAAAAQGGRCRAGPVAGTGGCPPAEPAAASVPLLGDGMTSGSARPGPSRATCGPGVAGVHGVTAAARPGSRPGSFHQAPASSAGTRHCERHRHQRS